jgi:hypothetical protein
MTVSISPATEALLYQEAALTGQAPYDLANALLLEELTRLAQEREETIEGIKRGLQAVEEGRCRPFEEYVADIKGRRAERNL